MKQTSLNPGSNSKGVVTLPYNPDSKLASAHLCVRLTCHNYFMYGGDDKYNYGLG